MLCTLGDVLLDVVLATRPGAWIPDADTPAATRVGAGGQAANVAAWAVALGGRARVVAKQASDLAGQLVAADLRRRGVELAGPVAGGATGATGTAGGSTGTAGGATGVVVAISECGGERTMLTDRGVCPQLSAAELREEWFAGCDRLHLPLYSLVDAPIREAALAAARRVPRVSVDLSSVSVLREIGVGEVGRLLGLLAPEVIFANEPESELVAGLLEVAGLPEVTTGPRATRSPKAANSSIATSSTAATGATVVVKLGSRGVRVNGRRWPARPARPVDSTGAGDAFAAGFLLGGVPLGLEAAARAVSQLGAMP